MEIARSVPRGYLFAGAVALALAVAGCSSASSPSATKSPATDSPAASSASPIAVSSTPSRPVSWTVASSAQAGGGMAALIAAAKKEGTLNVIGLPPTYANYGRIIKTFSKKYGIKVNELDPLVGSQQEVTQIKQHQGSAQAADVLDVETPVAVANATSFAPYQVATWSAIPAGQKASNGTWVQDYGGYMSIGYDPTRFGKITSLSQLLSHKFANSIALDGSPTQASSALYGVMMANLALGGSTNDISAGVTFFRRLAAGGNLVSVPATTPLTIKSG